MSYLSVSVIEHHDEGYLWTEGFIWAYGSSSSNLARRCDSKQVDSIWVLRPYDTAQSRGTNCLIVSWDNQKSGFKIKNNFFYFRNSISRLLIEHTAIHIWRLRKAKNKKITTSLLLCANANFLYFVVLKKIVHFLLWLLVQLSNQRPFLRTKYVNLASFAFHLNRQKKIILWPFLW